MARGSLDADLYNQAKQSEMMTALTPGESLENFTGHQRPAPSVMVMFHDGKCHICQKALPELEMAARTLQKREVDVAIGHVDSTDDKSLITKFNLKGLPAVLFWRSRYLAQGLSVPEALPDAKELLSERLQVVDDDELILRACRKAGMSEEAQKKKKRLQAAGKAGIVISVDMKDQTAKINMADLGDVWFPLEALRDMDGAPLPYDRLEVAKHFRAERTGWEREAMTKFAERMLKPVVLPLESTEHLLKQMRNETEPAFIFCGTDLTAGFREFAADIQDVAYAFQAKSPAACPSTGPTPRVVVYSPPWQQWSAKAKTAKAAMTVAGPDVVRDDEALLRWISSHRYPGLVRLGFSNFREFVRADRHALVAAIDTGAFASHKMVEGALLEVGRPEEIGDHREFTFNESSYYLGVVDGRLPGMDSYGVRPSRLPRLILMEGSDQWVEDEEEFRVEGLPQDLEKVPRLWRTSGGFAGTIVMFRKSFRKTMDEIEGVVDKSFGYAGIWVVRFVLVVGLVYMAVLAQRLGTAMGESLVETEEDAAASGAGAGATVTKSKKSANKKKQ